MSQQNKEIFAQLMEQVFNQGDTSAVSDLVALDFVNHESPDSRGPDGFAATAFWLRMAFPDLHTELLDVIAEGDLVVGRMLVSGTHQGEFMGMAPTGRRFSVQHIHIYRFVNGRIAEHWACRDDIGQMAQLGLTASPA